MASKYVLTYFDAIYCPEDSKQVGSYKNSKKSNPCAHVVFLFIIYLFWDSLFSLHM